MTPPTGNRNLRQTRLNFSPSAGSRRRRQRSPSQEGPSSQAAQAGRVSSPPRRRPRQVPDWFSPLRYGPRPGSPRPHIPAHRRHVRLIRTMGAPTVPVEMICPRCPDGITLHPLQNGNYGCFRDHEYQQVLIEVVRPARIINDYQPDPNASQRPAPVDHDLQAVIDLTDGDYEDYSRPPIAPTVEFSRRASPTEFTCHLCTEHFEAGSDFAAGHTHTGITNCWNCISRMVRDPISRRDAPRCPFCREGFSIN